MGAYKCQYGYTHKVCRCPKPHSIRCDKPDEHSPSLLPRPAASPKPCIVLTQRIKDGRMGKHEAHEPHDWWYTSWGGGHQMNEISNPEKDWDSVEGQVKRWRCPGIAEGVCRNE